MTTLWRHSNEPFDLFRGIGLFSGCTKGELSRIGSLSTMVEVPEGTVMVQEGRQGREFFVVVDGAATASRRGVWLADFHAGSFFGELALLDGGARTATVVADTDMILLVLSRIEFNSLETSAPSVNYNMLAELGARLRRTDDLLDEEWSSAASRPSVAVGASLR
jgi:CRP/FNR family transcriptional regulator, cyclic AMP receptor protein